MRKEEFLNNLRKSLSGLPKEDIDDILRDQEEYIRDAISTGRSEENVMASLGDPKVFAANLQAETTIQLAQDSTTLNKKIRYTLSALVAVLALAPLNIIFVLGPFVGLVACIFSGWSVALSGVIVAFSGLGLFLFELILIDVSAWTHISAFFLSMSGFGVSALVLILMFYISKFFLKATIAYLKWNLQFIKSRG